MFRKFNRISAMSLVFSAAGLMIAQPRPATVSFEVISIKANHSEDFHFTPPRFVGGRYSAMNFPLLFLISNAYDVPFQSPRVIGLPKWAGERFDIDAKAAEDVLPPSLPTSERTVRRRALLQSLLADRFKMAVHREEQTMSFYALEVAKNGPKLDKAPLKEEDCVEDPSGDQISCHTFNGGQGRGLHGKAVNMDDLAGYIENWTDHPVLNKTGLTGLFSIETMGWSPMRDPPPAQPAPGTPAPATIAGPPTGEGAMWDPTRPTLFMVLQRLGLELKLEKGPISVFVIDHIEKPGAN